MREVTWVAHLVLRVLILIWAFLAEQAKQLEDVICWVWGSWGMEVLGWLCWAVGEHEQVVLELASKVLLEKLLR